jgi:rare lipoprotein A (peptidoglycan hydrolase)
LTKRLLNDTVFSMTLHKRHTMRHKLQLLWAALLWVPIMFLAAQAMDAPLVARSNEPVRPLKTWTGNASWYGADFDGKKTANGEEFDSEALTAAHPNLPFGSIVRVVNPKNHKFEVVRINDRGPYQEGREIDVSYRVARKIGLINSGVVKVRLELMQLPQRP